MWKREANIYHYHPPQPSLPHHLRKWGSGRKEGVRRWQSHRMLILSHMVPYKPSNTVTQTTSYQQQGRTGKGTHPSAQILTVPGRPGLEKAKRTTENSGKKSPVTTPRMVISPGILHQPLLDCLNSARISVNIIPLLNFSQTQFVPSATCKDPDWDKSIIVYRTLSQSHGTWVLKTNRGPKVNQEKREVGKTWAPESLKQRLESQSTICQLCDVK